MLTALAIRLNRRTVLPGALALAVATNLTATLTTSGLAGRWPWLSPGSPSPPLVACRWAPCSVSYSGGAARSAARGSPIGTRTLIVGSTGASVALAALVLLGSNPFPVMLSLLALGVFDQPGHSPSPASPSRLPGRLPYLTPPAVKTKLPVEDARHAAPTGSSV